jgi:hypothetical protein
MQVMDILKKPSWIILTGSRYHINAPEGVYTCHLQVEHARYKNYPVQPVLRIVLSGSHLLQHINPLLGCQVPMHESHIVLKRLVDYISLLHVTLLAYVTEEESEEIWI